MDRTLEVRKISDVEMRVFFKPYEYELEKEDIKKFMSREAMLGTICGADLKNLFSGEIILHFNPVINLPDRQQDVERRIKEYLDTFPYPTLEKKPR